ncbi:MAG: aldo/keto reductase [Ignavibacteriales bacterium]
MIMNGEIFPIGIGTYGIGVEPDNNHLDTLKYSFQTGQNFIDASYIYANGKTMEYLKDFFKSIPRDEIFINVMLEKYIEKETDVETQLDLYLKIMGIEYADTLMLHAPICSKLPLEETYFLMNRMVEKGKACSLSASNFSLEELIAICERHKFKLFCFEGLYNIECKVNEDVGIIDYCKRNEIEFVCYQPLRRNRTSNRNYDFLVDIANKYEKTQNQILINWIVKEKKLITSIRASRVEHVKENLESLDFALNREDIESLNNYRNKDFDSLKVDWALKGEGITIDQIPNQFS